MRIDTPTTSQNDHLVAQSRRYIAGGALALLDLSSDQQFVVDRGQGSHIWDVDGNEYIDYVMGSGPQILGHGDPEVLDAVRHQLGAGTQFYALTEPAIELAAQLVDAVPCGGLVRFTSTGNEATFMALRLARAFTGRELVLKFEGGYHGTHDYALMSSKPRVYRPYPESTADSAGIPRAILDLVLTAPFNDAEILTSLLETHGRGIAAIIVEPLFRGIPPERGFLEALRQLTTKYGIVLVFDEVVTGFRVAWGGGQELYGVTPDLATYGKAIGGGFPIAAVIGSAEIMNLMGAQGKGPGEQVVSGGTFSGNPISAAAGLTALHRLGRPGVYDRLWFLGKRLGDGLRALIARHGEAGVVYATGPVVDLFFTEHPEANDYRTSHTADSWKSQLLARELLKRRVFTNPGASFYLSLQHSEADIDETLARCDEALEVVAASTRP
jgi:glutamate-1-semialdehyde 2,1-aminomutase